MRHLDGEEVPEKEEVAVMEIDEAEELIDEEKSNNVDDDEDGAAVAEE